MERLLVWGDSPDSYATVHEYWDHNSGWKWNLLEGKLPAHELIQLNAVLARKDNDEADGTSWGLSSNGSFTVKAVYSLLLNPHHFPNDTWKTIRKVECTPKSKNVFVGHSSWADHDKQGETRVGK